MKKLALLISVSLLGCGGSSAQRTTQTVQHGDDDRGSETPLGADAQLEDARLLAMDLAAAHICQRARGRLMPVGGDGEEAAEGRMWIRDCSARVEDDELVIEAGVLLWTWVDRSSSAVGARFTVEQYVALEADVELRAIPQLTYRRDEHHALVWLEPVQEPTVSVRVVGNVDAEAQGLWSEVVAFAAGVFGPSENERAASRVREQGDLRLERRVDDGMTFALDLCTSEMTAELGHMTEMPGPQRPDTGVEGPSKNVRVHPMGLDMAGPFTEPAVTIEVLDGAAVRAQLVCEEDGHRMVDAWLSGGLDAMEDEPASPVTEARVASGPTRVAAQGEPACDTFVLVTQVVPDGEASATFSFAGPDTRPAALIDGCEADLRRIPRHANP